VCSARHEQGVQSQDESEGTTSDEDDAGPMAENDTDNETEDEESDADIAVVTVAEETPSTENQGLVSFCALTFLYRGHSCSCKD
jgi:hypothetical protein